MWYVQCDAAKCHVENNEKICRYIKYMGKIDSKQNNMCCIHVMMKYTQDDCLCINDMDNTKRNVFQKK